MNSKNKYQYYSYISFILILIYTFFEFIFEGSHILTGLSGDSMKNVYTYLYQMQNGHGYWFTGMNYPFGEHIIYTDAQPLLVIPLSYIDHIFPLSHGFGLFLLHIIPIITFFFCMVYVQKILQYFGSNWWLSTILAICISILSPQSERIFGHYALSYSCFIPMMMYWHIRYHREGNRQFLINIAILICIFSFLHLYYLSFALFWFAGYIFLLLFGLPRNWTRLWQNTLTIGIPGGLVFALIRLTDPVKDRVKEPFGFYYYIMDYMRLILDNRSPFLRSLDEIFHTNMFVAPEGYIVYIGAATTLILIVTIVLLIFGYRNSQPFPFIFIVVGFFIMFVSMGIPFIWYKNITDHLSFVRQFRTIDRQAWTFYYLITIAAAVQLSQIYQWLIKKRKLPIAITLVVIFCGIWILDMNGMLLHIRHSTANMKTDYINAFENKDNPNFHTILQSHGLDTSDVQCILTMPLTILGNEKFMTEDLEMANHALLIGFMGSMQLHKPLMDIMMSRTSLTQSLQQKMVQGGWLIPKPIFQMIDERPILLMVNEAYNFGPDENYLIDTSLSQYLETNYEMKMYLFYPKKFLKSQETYIATKIKNETHHAKPLIYEHFDHATPSSSIFGNAYGFTDTNSHLLISQDLDLDPHDSLYNWSLWSLSDWTQFRSPLLAAYFTDAKNDTVLYQDLFMMYNVAFYNQWVFSSKYFHIPKEVKHVYMVLAQSDKKSFDYIDEIQLRVANQDIYYRQDTTQKHLFINNRLIMEK